MNTINKIIVGMMLFAAVPMAAEAQDDKKMDSLLAAKTYVFNASTALPMRGSSIQLTSPYTMQVGPDTVVADLPYFGRAFVAPINPSDGGIRFTSTNFGYASKQAKSGRHDIVITPKDANGTRQLRLSVSNNGYATLNVSSNRKDNISFYGTITEVPTKK